MHINKEMYAEKDLTGRTKASVDPFQINFYTKDSNPIHLQLNTLFFKYQINWF